MLLSPNSEKISVSGLTFTVIVNYNTQHDEESKHFFEARGPWPEVAKAQGEIT
jgi:hypothetical protein